uniref:GDSL esterase/lipase 1-like isoform X1 n=1 Tax=Tanacetum cinerariifolium TaxID=118510 RepID=A0A699GXD2_TANCI|nr:GDSL esterase/lipase 1-like isoform X1 [Tanacetum cinerariifolium]
MLWEWSFRGIFSCGGKRGITEYELCDDVTEFFLFESSHPTELAYRQFAEMFWKGDYMVTVPYNLQAFFKGIYKKEDENLGFCRGYGSVVCGSCGVADHEFAELFWKGDPMVTGPYNLKALFDGKP